MPRFKIPFKYTEEITYDAYAEANSIEEAKEKVSNEPFMYVSPKDYANGYNAVGINLEILSAEIEEES